MVLQANALATVAECQAYLDIAAGTDNSLIEALVNRASDRMEKFCGNFFINRALTENYDGNGEDILFLRYYPVVSVASIKEDGTAVTDTYYTYGEEGYLQFKSRVWTTGVQNWEIAYTAGRGATHSDVPQELKQACIKQVQWWYKRDKADYSQTFGESVIIKEKDADMPEAVKGLLGPYRKRRIGAV